MALNLRPTQQPHQPIYETEVAPLSIGLIRCVVAIALLAAFLPEAITSIVTHVAFSVVNKTLFFGDAEVVFGTAIDLLGVFLGLLLLFNTTAKRFFRILTSRRYLRKAA